MSPRPSVRQSGFTLIEVMIAVLLSTVALSAMFSAMGTASQCGANAKLRDLAVTELQRQVESAQATVWTNISAIYTQPGTSATTRWFGVTGLAAPIGRQAVGSAALQSQNGVQYLVRYECQWVNAYGQTETARVDYVAANQGR